MVAIRRAARSIGARARDERGLTLSELLVAMFMFGIVMAVFTATLASVQKAVVAQDNLSRTNDQARLAVEQLDRELRSGNVIYDPADEVIADRNYKLRIYTQTNQEFRCVLWNIDADHQLLTRSWAPGEEDEATGWRVVATGIMNRELGITAFELDPDTLKGDRTLMVTLRVNDNYDNAPEQTLEITESLTGRNTSYGYPVSICQTDPT